MASFPNRVGAALTAFLNPGKPKTELILPPDAGEHKEYPLPLIWNLISPGRYSWSLVDFEAYAREGFSQNEVIYSAIKYKMDSIAQTPLKAYTLINGRPELVENQNSPLFQLAARPNEYMGVVQFMQLCVLYLNLHGNSFTYLKTRPPYGLYPLRPDRVQIIPDENKRVLGFLYYPDGTSVEKAVPIRNEEMLHVKLPNPYDPLEGLGYGLSPLSAAARSGDVDNRMTQFLGEFFARNGIMPGGVIELPQESDIDEMAKLRESWLEAYGGSSKWGKPLVIDSGGTFKPMMPSFSEMALDNIDLRNIRRITSVFGVDGKLIGLDSENSTYNNMAEAENAFWTRVMITELRLFEEEMAYKVKLSPNEFLRFDLSAVPAFAEDVNTQIDNYIKLVQNMVPANDAITLLGLRLPKIEGGDMGFISSSYLPVEQAMKEPEPPPMPNAAQLAAGLAGEQGDGKKPAPEDETPASKEERAAAAVRKNFKLYFDFDTKDRMAESQDRIAHSYEPKLAKSAIKQFGKDKAEVMRLFNKAKKSYHKQRKAMDWNDFENSIRFYLFVKGQQEWSWEFAVWFVELAWDARDDWIDRMKLREAFPTIDFDAIFLTRSSIEGEAWFANYTLQFSRAITNTTSEGIHAVIRDGLADGMGTDRIGKKIELLFDQYMEGNTAPEDWEFMQERMPAWRTEMIARTETHGAMSAANHDFFKRTGATHKEWFATADDRTRDSHLQAWDTYSEGGRIGPIPIDEKFIVGGAEMKYPGDKSAPLREFINCFPAGTVMQGNIEGASKVWYTGKVRELVTARGNRLTITPNHPVLTANGWVKAGELKKGDQLLSYVQERGLNMLGDINDYNEPACIEDIFNALSANGTLRIGMVSTLDFDGDGQFGEGQIEIVSINRELPMKGNPQLSIKHGLQFDFIAPSRLSGFLIEPDSPPNLGFFGVGTSTPRAMGGSNLPMNQSRVLLDSPPFNSLLFGRASQFHTVSGKKSRDDGSRVSVFLSELIDASACQIAFDNLVSVREYDFSGHVYDLQAVDGWILAQNIVTSNCRCVELPYYPEME